MLSVSDRGQSEIASKVFGRFRDYCSPVLTYCNTALFLSVRLAVSALLFHVENKTLPFNQRQIQGLQKLPANPS